MEPSWRGSCLVPASPAPQHGPAIMEPAHSAAQIILRLTGSLDVAALRAALALFVEQHETLPAVSAASGGLAAAESARRPEPVLPLLDMSAEPHDSTALDGIITTIIAEESLTTLGLSEPPPFRCWLVRLRPADHVLSLVMHRQIAEKSPAQALLGELPVLYAAARRGGQLSSPRLADSSTWRRQNAQTGEAFGRKAKSAECAAPGVNVEFVLSRETRDGLRAAAGRIEASVPMLVLGALTALLGRHADLHDIVVGVPIPPLYLPVPIRVDVSGDQDCAEIARQVQAELATARAPGRPDQFLFQVMFDSLTEEDVRYGAGHWDGGVRATIAYSDTTPASMSLALVLTETANRLKVRMRYRKDIFSKSEMFSIASRLATTLAVVAGATGGQSPGACARSGTRPRTTGPEEVSGHAGP
jgi:Condensation domain